MTVKMNRCCCCCCHRQFHVACWYIAGTSQKIKSKYAMIAFACIATIAHLKAIELRRNELPCLIARGLRT